MLKYLCSTLFFSIFVFVFTIGLLPARDHKYTTKRLSPKALTKALKSENLGTGRKKRHQDNFVVMMGPRNHGGMFHVFDRVANLTKCYDSGSCRGIEVNFDDRGIYYEPSLGKNWWSYYCKPLCLGKKINVKTVIRPGAYIAFEKKDAMLRREIFCLIQKYFHVKAHIQNKINTFERENLKKNFVISVHYRGTDKIAESPYVPYEKVPEEIRKVMETYKDKQYKIFIATDEQAFLDYMIGLFGDLVCYNKDALRSTNGKPVHLDKNFSRYKCGEDALIDCILLSKGKFLIRSSSNLSRWSTYFNPNIPVVELNTRYDGRTPKVG